MTALTSATLAHPPQGVSVPGFDRAAATAAVVHLGVGGFHRSHQAVFFQRLLEEDHLGWGIHGVGVLGADAALQQALAPQDLLYTLVLRDNDGSSAHHVIGSLLSYTLAPQDPEAVCAVLAAATTAVVTMTITEGGYSIDKATGTFIASEALRADARPGAVPATAFGFVLEGLRRRRAAGLSSFTVVSCDNLQHNGDLARTALLGFATLADPELARWIAEHTAFPNSMVDRITPATTATDRERLAQDTGIQDNWPVVAEPYLQWVLEDRFSAERPPLEQAGVQLVSDVAPYEMMKLRLLNASHQVMSYLGVLAGFEYVHQVCADPAFVGLLRRWMDAEARPTLAPVQGVDLDDYRDSLLHRFANPAIGDTLARNCAQGSERIATFVLPVIRQNLEDGGDISVGALAVAAWARYARGMGLAGQSHAVVDERWATLEPLLEASAHDPAAILSAQDVFADLGHHPRFRSAFLEADQLLERLGAHTAVVQLSAAPAGAVDASPAGQLVLGAAAPGAPV